MNEKQWLIAEMQCIVGRLRAEKAEGVILAIHYDDAEQNHLLIHTDGVLCLTDGVRLGNAICKTLLESKSQELRPTEITLPTPVVSQ